MSIGGFKINSQVLTADKTYKNIQDIKVGEYVLSYDEVTNELKPQIVEHVSHVKKQYFAKFTFSDDSTVECTTKENFLTVAGGYAVAGVNDQVYTSEAGTYKTIVSKEIVDYGTEQADSYALDIEDIDNFIVNGIVVHNGDIDNPTISDLHYTSDYYKDFNITVTNTYSSSDGVQLYLAINDNDPYDNGTYICNLETDETVEINDNYLTGQGLAELSTSIQEALSNGSTFYVQVAAESNSDYRSDSVSFEESEFEHYAGTVVWAEGPGTNVFHYCIDRYTEGDNWFEYTFGGNEGSFLVGSWPEAEAGSHVISYYADASTGYHYEDGTPSSAEDANDIYGGNDITINATGSTSTTITVTKRSNISSISLTYYTSRGTQATISDASGTYTAKYNTSYSWTATAANGYTASPSSGSGTTGETAISIAPTAVHATITITVTKNTGVASIALTYHNASGTEVTDSNASGTYYAAQYMDYEWTATAADYYTMDSSSGSGQVRTTAISISPTATINSYTVSMSSTNGTVTVSSDGKTYGSTATVAYGGTVYYKVTPNAHYYYSSTSYYNGNPYSSSITLNSSNFTISSGSATKALSACTAITYTFKVISSGSDYCYYGDTAPSTGMTATVTGTYANRANYTVFYKINPSVHYYCNTTAYYNGNPYSSSIGGSAFTFTDSNQTASWALNCTTITYTVSGGTATNGSVSWTNGKYYESSTWTITADSYYARPTTYTGSKDITTDNFTVTDSNQTAVYSGSLGTCTGLTETIQNKTVTGGQVYWATSSITTSGGSTTLAATYGSTVYWRIAANTGYDLPTTYYGSMTLNSTNFTIGSTTAASTATYKGSAIGNCTLKKFAVTISSGTGCSANKASGTYEYGTVITWTASDGYSFNGSSTKDTTTATITSAGTYSATPSYVQVTLSMTNCTYTSGNTNGQIVAKGTNLSTTFTVVNSSWSYSEGTSQTATETKTASSVQAPTTLSSSPAYTHGAVTYTRCSNSTYATGYHKAGSFTVTADSDYRFTSSSNTTTGTWSTGCNLSFSPTYYNITVVAGTGCSANVSSGYVTLGTKITWTADSTHSFGGSAVSDTTTATVAAGTASYSKTPGYVKCTISSTRCTCDKTDGTIYAIGTTITWTRSSGYAFSSSGTTTATDTVVGSKSSYSCTASYMNITISGSYCTADKSSGYNLIGSTITWTANANYSFGGSSCQDTATATIAVGTTTYSKAPGYVKCTITTGSYNASVNKTSGNIYAVGTVITWTAASSYSYGGSSTGDTGTATVALGTTSYSKNPGYVKCTISGTRCSANKTSGTIIAVGTTITWTAETGYAFGTSGTSTTTQNVALGTTSYSKSANYENITVSSGTGCSANVSSGYVSIGTTITWTATSSYSFNGSAVSDTTTATVAAGTTSYSKTPGYVKCTISGTRCSADKTSGAILAVGTTITWTASSGYAFSTSGTSTATASVAVGTTSYSKSADYENVTISAGTGCSANKSSGYLAIGTTITWTASDGYSFGGSSCKDTTTATVAAGTTSYSKTPGYVQVTLSATNCAYSSGNTNGQIVAKGTDLSTTFAANDYYSYSEGTSRTSSETKTASSVQAPTTLSSSPAYVYGTVSYTRCSNSTYATGYHAAGTFTVTASSGYRFTTSSATTTGTWSKNCSLSFSPTYYNITVSSGTGCSANVSSGYVTLGTTITWTATSSYSFGGSKVSDTTTATVTAGTASYSKTPGYVKCSISGTRCTANKTDGTIYAVGTTITWTASSGYGFDTSGTSTATQNVAVGTTSYSKSANYESITVASGTGCSANVSSGYVLIGTVITWTATSYYSFAGSSAGDTTTASVVADTANYSKTPSYVKCTISGTNCTANKTSGALLATGTVITWTASSGYAFSNTGTSTATATVALGTTSYSKSAKRYIVVAPTAESKTWDGTTLSASNTASITSGSLASGDTITYTCTGTTSSSNAGTYSGAKTISAVVIKDSSSATVTSNYYINNTSSANLVINKAAVTPVAPTLKTGLTYTSVGQALCNAGTSSYGTYYYGLSSDTCTSTSVPTGTNATTYTVYWKWTADGNHTGSTDAASAGTVTIATRTITVTVVAKSKVYGASDPTLQYTYSNKTQDSGTTEVSTSYGTDTMCVTLSRASGETAGKYNITGSATFSANGTYTNYALSVSGGSNAFSIACASLSAIAKPADTNYTGSAQTPTPDVTAVVGGATITLTKDTDYTLSYQNNTNAGTATVTAVGKGNYTDAVQNTWTINKIASSITLSSTGITKATGSTVNVASYVSAHTSTGALSYAITTNGTTTASTIDGSTVTLGAMSSANDTAQSVVVTITNPGDGNYNSSTKTFTITVIKNAYTLTFNNSTSSVTYGSTLSVAATCSPSATLTYATTGTYTSISGSTLTGTLYSGSNKDTITATAARTTTYAQKSITRTVSVTKATPTMSITSPVAVTYSASSQTKTLAASVTGGGTITFDTSSLVVSNSSGTILSGWSITSAGVLTIPAGTSVGNTPYSVSVTITGAASTNYNSITDEKTYTLNFSKATGTVTYSPSALSLNYIKESSQTTTISAASTNTGQTISYTLNSVTNSSGTAQTGWSLSSRTITVPAAAPAGSYTVSVTASVAASTNYTAASSGAKTFTFTINKTTPVLTVSGAGSYTYDGNNHGLTCSVTINGNSSPAGTIKYGTSSSSLTSSVTYASGVSIGSIKNVADSPLTRYAQFVPTDTSNYNSSAVSSANTVTLTKAAGSITYSPSAASTTYNLLEFTDLHITVPTSSTGQSISVTLTDVKKDSSSISFDSWTLTYTAGYSYMVLSIPYETDAGTYTVAIEAVAEANSNYNKATTTKSFTLTINKYTPVIYYNDDNNNLTFYNDVTASRFVCPTFAGVSTIAGEIQYLDPHFPDESWFTHEVTGDESALHYDELAFRYAYEGIGTSTYSWYFVPTDTTNFNSVGSSSSPLSTAYAIIKKGTISSIVDIPAQTYTGSALKPFTGVIDSAGHTMTSSVITGIAKESFAITYANNTNAGTATITITPDTDYYTNTAALSATFTINQVALGAIATPSNTNYTGSAQTPTPAVTATVAGATKTLTKDTDYELTYKNNTNAGTATVTAKGIGNYTGSVSANWTINKIAQTAVIATNSPVYASGSNMVKVTTTASGGASIYYAVGTELTIDNYASKGSTTIPTVGTRTVTDSPYTVYYYIPTVTNYLAKSGSVSVTVQKAASTLPTVFTGDSKYYHDDSGNIQTASLTYSGYSGGTIYFASSTTSASSGFGSWTTTAPTRSGSVGSTYVKCYIKGDGNHNDSAESTVVSLTINANSDAAMVVTVGDAATYDGNRHVIATASNIHGIQTYYLGYSITSSTDSTTVTWGNANTATISATDAHTYYIWYKFTCDSAHSNSKDPTYVGSVTISKATGTCTVTPTGDLSYQVPDSATIAVPTQTNTLYYNAATQSPTWSNSTTYAKVEASSTGDTASAIEANTYHMTASLVGASYFETKTDTTKSATGTGTLSVSSSNTNVATVSISNGTISVVYKGTPGETTITVTSAATTNYTAATATFKATCTFGSYIWSDGTKANKSVSWTISPIAYYHNGTAWQPVKGIKIWNGSAWVYTKHKIF